MTCTPEHLAKQIREKGFRMTPQRFAILNILIAEGGHLFATDIYSRGQVLTPGLTEPTVYRTLEFLVENDLVRMTHTGNGKLAYELARHPHHHVKCIKCGQEQEILQHDMEKIYAQVENIVGYRLTETHLTFSGLCPVCKPTGG